MSRELKRNHCGSGEHALHRRRFLQAGAAMGVGLGGLDLATRAGFAEDLRRRERHVLLLWLGGGASQLETFDPKPGTPTGGPFKAISTAVPGIAISELMPRIAQRLGQVAIVRSLDTRIGDHGGAATLMETGRTPEPGLVYPEFGAVIARELGQIDSQVPDFISLDLATEGHRRPEPGFLGGRYAAMHLTRTTRPENIDLPEGLTDLAHTEREHLRQFLSERFNRGRQAEEVHGYNST
jgi:hypothetical protein